MYDDNGKSTMHLTREFMFEPLYKSRPFIHCQKTDICKPRAKYSRFSTNFIREIANSYNITYHVISSDVYNLLFLLPLYW